MEEIRVVAAMHERMYRSLWFFLRGVSEAELDWRIHPEANSIRWILGHLIYIEAWTADALEGTSKYLTDRQPESLEVVTLDDARERFAAAFQRTQHCLNEVREAELERPVDMMGRVTLSLRDMLHNHVTHFAGHLYQVRFIRGTHSRALGTRKADFDPW